MPTTSSATSSVKLSYCEFGIWLREYRFQTRFPDARAVTGQYPLAVVEQTCREQLTLFVMERVPEFRWDELFDHCWFMLWDQPWLWEQRMAQCIELHLDAMIDEYIRKHPRRYRSIDED